MTITNEERQRRRETLGASDLPAILGFQQPWRNGADVQASKLFDLAEPDENENVELGNLVERPLCEWAGQKLGLTIEYPPDPIIHDLLPIHANLDGLVPGECVVEAKLTGYDDEWREPETDQVPDGVTVQVQQQMYLAGVGYAIVPVLFVGLRRRRAIYRVERDDELIDELLRRAEEWWHRHVTERQPVPPDPPSLSTLKRIVRVPSKVAVVDAGLVQDYRLKAQAATEADKAKKAAQARLLAQLGDAEAGTDEDGRVAVTYFEYDRKGYTVAPSKYRSIRLAKEDA